MASLNLKLEGFSEANMSTASTISAMSSMEPKLSHEEAADKSAEVSAYSDDKVFIILRDFLQPSSSLSLKSTVEAIIDLLPDNALSNEVWSFGSVCFELAEQIPYYHPSQQKLARLLEELVESDKITEQFYPTNKKNAFYNRHQRLGECMRDQLARPDDERVQEYVNYQAFVANLFEHRIFRTNPTYAIWAMRDALESSLEKEEASIRDAYILGAAQWILWHGQGLFMQIRYPGHESKEDKRLWNPGELYKGGEPLLTVHRWHFWADRFKATVTESKGMSEECSAVVGKAVSMMECIERSMTL